MAGITIKQLEALVQVADQGRFRKAASILNTTQPNISSRIAVLEQTLDAKLMERNGGSIELTPIGRELLLKAKRVISSVDDFLVTANNKDLFDGVLRLGVTEMVVHSWLTQFLSSFYARYPNVQLDLTVDLSANLSTALESNAVDLALQNGPFKTESSASVKIGSYPWAWVVAPALLHSNKTQQPFELSAHPILTHAKETLPVKQLASHFANQAVRYVPSSSLSACLKMATDGLGVACLPEAMIAESLQSQQLRKLEYHWVPDALQFFARYDVDRANHVVAEAVNLAKEASAIAAQQQIQAGLA